MIEIGKYAYICGFTSSDITAPLPDTARPSGVAVTPNGALWTAVVTSGPGGLPGTLETIALDTDATVPAGHQGLAVFSVPVLWGGIGRDVFIRQAASSADNMNPNVGAQPAGVALVGSQAEWSLPHAPAVGARATITQPAAGAGLRHVCRAISATLTVAAADVAVAGALAVLRDGATGVGTILWEDRLAVVVAGGQARVQIAGLNITGSDGAAMTLEFIAAPGAASFQNVTLTGKTVNN